VFSRFLYSHIVTHGARYFVPRNPLFSNLVRLGAVLALVVAVIYLNLRTAKTIASLREGSGVAQRRNRRVIAPAPPCRTPIIHDAFQSTAAAQADETALTTV
jgi:hypothetical protein